MGALLQISRALQIDSAYFLKEQESKLEKRIRAYAKRTDNYAYETLTPGAENKHLKAFKVSIDPKQDHQGVGYQHEGEEFVYLVKGDIEIVVGDHAFDFDLMHAGQKYFVLELHSRSEDFAV